MIYSMNLRAPEMIIAPRMYDANAELFQSIDGSMGDPPRPRTSADSDATQQEPMIVSRGFSMRAAAPRNPSGQSDMSRGMGCNEKAFN